MSYTIEVNGSKHTVEAEGDTPLLWVLRDVLDHDRHQVSAAEWANAAPAPCTRTAPLCAPACCRWRASAICASRPSRASAPPRSGSKVQEKWLALDVPQCGYCQGGQIMSATALLTHTVRPGDADIDAAMAGNLCRCGCYAADSRRDQAHRRLTHGLRAPTMATGIADLWNDPSRHVATELPDRRQPRRAAGCFSPQPCRFRQPARAAAPGTAPTEYPDHDLRAHPSVGNGDHPCAESGNGAGHENGAADDLRGGARCRVEGRDHRNGGLSGRQDGQPVLRRELLDPLQLAAAAQSGRSGPTNADRGGGQRWGVPRPSARRPTSVVSHAAERPFAQLWRARGERRQAAGAGSEDGRAERRVDVQDHRPIGGRSGQGADRHRPPAIRHRRQGPRHELRRVPEGPGVRRRGQGRQPG